LESCLTELAILLIIRTARPAWRSRPSRFLLLTSAGVAAAVVTIPPLPFAVSLGFDPLPPALLAGMVGIAVLYAGMGELTKGWFFKRFML
jgi:Mg2+-importing ATPase